jgi:hypothetical protein
MLHHQYPGDYEGEGLELRVEKRGGDKAKGERREAREKTEARSLPCLCTINIKP